MSAAPAVAGDFELAEAAGIELFPRVIRTRTTCRSIRPEHAHKIERSRVMETPDTIPAMELADMGGTELEVSWEASERMASGFTRRASP